MYVAGRPTFKKEWTIGNRTLYSVGSRGGGGDKGWGIKKVFFFPGPSPGSATALSLSHSWGGLTRIAGLECHSYRSAIQVASSAVLAAPIAHLRVSTRKVRRRLRCLCPWRGSQITRFLAGKPLCRKQWPARPSLCQVTVSESLGRV